MMTVAYENQRSRKRNCKDIDESSEQTFYPFQYPLHACAPDTRVEIIFPLIENAHLHEERHLSDCCW